MGIAYGLVAWLVAQLLQLVFQTFGAPDWVMKAVLVLALAHIAHDKFVLDPARDAELVQSTLATVAEQMQVAEPESTTPDQSIAVLHFVNQGLALLNRAININHNQGA